GGGCAAPTIGAGRAPAPKDPHDPVGADGAVCAGTCCGARRSHDRGAGPGAEAAPRGADDRGGDASSPISAARVRAVQSGNVRRRTQHRGERATAPGRDRRGRDGVVATDPGRGGPAAEPGAATRGSEPDSRATGRRHGCQGTSDRLGRGTTGRTPQCERGPGDRDPPRPRLPMNEASTTRPTYRARLGELTTA
ncbi:hypothetical protein NECAME_19328, partial [Necator americanus]